MLKGYYEHVRDYKGGLDLVFLEQFKKPGGLSAYSMQLYKGVITSSEQPMLTARLSAAFLIYQFIYERSCLLNPK